VYTLQGGSTLPDGVTLSSNGLLSGTASALTSATVVSFTILVNDAQLQTVQQAITLSLTFGDDYFKSTTLAIQANTTPFISDASNNNLVLTPSGNVKVNEANPFQDGYYSTQFNTSGYLNTTADATFTGDFTFECWAYLTAYSGTSCFFTIGNESAGRYYFALTGTGGQLWSNVYGGGNFTWGTATSVPLNTWTHVAWVRSGTTVTGYVNGVSVGTQTISGTVGNANGVWIGANPSGGYLWSGYLNNVRLINGVALYTEAFTPPTAPLTTVEPAVTYTAPSTVDYLVVGGGGGGSYLVGGGGGGGGMLTGTSLPVTPNTSLAITVGNGGTGATTQVSGGSGGYSAFSNSADTTYSGVFTGSSYIRKSGAGVLATAGGDLTIETWIYANTSSITGLYDGGPGEANIIRNLTANTFGWQGNDAGGANITGKFPVSTWFHLAITYSSSGSVVKAYINGALAATGAAGNYSVGGNFDIGGTNGAASFNGYLSNFRVTNRLVYTANFAPPISPLSAVANTSYLVFKNATIIDNSINSYTITPNSVTVSSTVVPPIGIVAFGGGGGGAWSAGVGLSGGSGGGGSGAESGGGAGGQSTLGQGNAGGAGAGARLAGGGGGAGAVGETAGTTVLTAGNGGAGISSSISGTTTYYAGGGGGGSETTNANNFPGNGGIGGGGKGGGMVAATVHANAGITSTGGGGGGGGNVSGSVSGKGGDGGSGIVIIRYADTASPAVTTGNPDIVVSGGYRIYRFTQSGTIKFRSTSSPAVTAAQTVLLTCQSSRFVDKSTNARTITVTSTPKITQVIPYTLPVNTYGSGYFATATDYVTTQAITMSSTAFTVECWINTTNKTAYAGLCKNGAAAEWNVSDIYIIGLDASGNSIWIYDAQASGGISLNGTTTVTDGAWHHVAFVYDGTNYKLYIDGVQNATTAKPAMAQTARVQNIGADIKSSRPWVGYISNFRIINGTALYTTAFTPSTAPLAAVTNTNLLTLQTKQSHNNNTYLDISSYNNAVTRVGAPSQGTFSPFSPAGWSTNFNGSTDALEYPSTYNLSSGASAVTCTVEAWFNTSTPATDQTIFGKYTDGNIGLRLGVSGSKVYAILNGNTTNITGTTTLLANTWYHVAISGSVGSWKLFLNGVQESTTFTGSVNLGGTSVSQIGRTSNVVYFNGNISNVRVVRGTALYTSNFTPSITALTAVTGTVLLACQDNRFKDNSVNVLNTTIVGTPKIQAISPFKPSSVYDPVLHSGSVYSPTTSDYLSTTMGDGQAFGTGDFTVEMWVYNTAVSHNLCMYATSTSSWAMLTYLSAFYWQENGTNLGNVGTVTLNAWTHYAVSRTASVLKIFINGVQFYSAANTYNYSNNTTARYVGVNGGSAGAYISNLVVTKGIGKYKGTFNPPTAPVTRALSTTFLLDSASAAITDASGRNNILTIGDAKVSTKVNKYGTGSMYFDGTGDYITCTNPQFAPGTGDFTIEGWVYNTTDVSNKGVFHLAATLLPSTISGLGLAFFGTSNTWTWLYNGTQTSFGSVPLLNTWYHFAMCRSGTSMRLFLNGVLLGTVSDSTNYTQTALAIGTYYSSGQAMGGYIDDFRITKGVARYTANFTPPTAISVS
jgi:hypothetical protein